jgi:uncharacterized membrane protein
MPSSVNTEQFLRKGCESMSDQNLTLLAAAYPNREHAQTTIDMLEKMHRALTITLKDATLVTRNEDGKIEVHETDELTTGKGAKRGAVIGGVVGLIFPPSILLTGALGGAIGGFLGRLRDTGIKNEEVKKLAEGLAPGQAAVIALVTDDTVVAAQNALSGYEGELVISSVSEDVMKKIYEAEASNETATGDRPDFR